MEVSDGSSSYPSPHEYRTSGAPPEDGVAGFTRRGIGGVEGGGVGGGVTVGNISCI